MLPANTTFVAVCPRTGVHLRPATFDETCAFWAGNPRPHFENPVRVGDVLVDTYCDSPDVCYDYPLMW